ncbi:hypothetical protein [Lysobacter gummosus]|uniref:hypothetical protein n=1 Tax=Lysobacter gummosus TaxID=262324 RepID=UPI003632B241
MFESAALKSRIPNRNPESQSQGASTTRIDSTCFTHRAGHDSPGAISRHGPLRACAALRRGQGLSGRWRPRRTRWRGPAKPANGSCSDGPWRSSRTDRTEVSDYPRRKSRVAATRHSSTDQGDSFTTVAFHIASSQLNFMMAGGGKPYSTRTTGSARHRC